MKKLILISSYLLFTMNIYSQVDPSINLYPLHIGDVWQYYVDYDSSFDNEDTDFYCTREVIGDTLLQNDFSYYIIKGSATHALDNTVKYFRIDSAKGCLMEFDEHGTGSEVMHDSLKMQPGDFFDHQLTSGYVIECTGLDTLEYFDEEREVKTFYMPLLNWTYEYKLASGLGLVHRQSSEPYIVAATRTSQLVYANINGKEYGTLVNNLSEKDYIPNKIALYQNYPNPFNPTTKIKYSLPSFSYVTIQLYNILGEQIDTLVDQYQIAGDYVVELNANHLSGGVYFYRMTSEESSITKKLLLLK